MADAVLYLGILTENYHDNMGQHANSPVDVILCGLYVPGDNSIAQGRNFKIGFYWDYEGVLNAGHLKHRQNAFPSKSTIYNIRGKPTKMNNHIKVM